MSSTSPPQSLEKTFIGPPVEGVDPQAAFESDPGAADMSRSMIEVGDGAAAYHPVEALRARLIAAAMLMLAGVGTFLIPSLFVNDAPLPAVRVIALITTVYVLGRLSYRSDWTAQRLRLLEAILFVPIGITTALLQLELQRQAMERFDRTQFLSTTYSSAMACVVMMMAYALLMPNGWRRTLIMLIPPSCLPVGCSLIHYVAHSSAPDSTTFLRLCEMQAGLWLALAIAVYGTYVLATFRTQMQSAQRLQQYRLIRMIDRGGMGTVYLAKHDLLKRPCAIKVINPQKGGERMAMELFEREVHATATLSHWNTVEIFDYGRTEDGLFYYVMEYLPGMNLGKLVQKFGPLPPARAIHFIRQTCGALQEAHQLGLIHRDLKPDNIFAAKRGGNYDVAKLLDFGLVNDEAEGDARRELASPVRGRIVGSAHYMAPEQSTGGPVDARSDIYGLGAVMYFLLTGKTIFSDTSIPQVLERHRTLRPRRPSELQPSIPRDLEDVVMKCLEKQPDARFQSIDALVAALEECLDSGGWTGRQAADWWRTHHSAIDAPLPA